MSTTAAKPTIVISHGAWHPPAVYEGFISKLKDASYDALIPTLPSLDNPDPTSATCAKDADAVRAAILPLLDEGKDVIVLAHSYGGIPAAGAAHGLSVETRKKQGQKGGVIGLVYASAFVVPEGLGLLTVMGGKHAPYLVPDQPIPNNSLIANAADVGFNDVPADEAARYVSLLRPHSMVSFDSPSPPVAWSEPDFTGRLGFVRCLLDNALPPPFQDTFTQKSGVEWKIKEVNAGHAPFVNKGEDVIAILDEWAGVWKS